MTVVLVNYNGWPDVLRLVSMLAEAAEVVSGACEVVVVDNASQSPMPEELRRPPHGVRIAARRDNGGFAVGVNTGWQMARSPWLLVLNPDVLVSPDLIGKVLARVERFESDPEGAPGIVGFGLKNPDGSLQPSVGAFPHLARAVWEQLIPRSRRKYQAVSKTRPGPVPWVTGACMLVNTRMLEILDGMDEDFFLYYEEVALCRTARQAGWRVEFDPGVSVVHLHPLQNRTISPTLRIITRHSKLLYFRKHLPAWQFFALSWMVSGDALIQRVWSGLRGRSLDERAWRTVGRISRALRAGAKLRGRDVRTLAEDALAPVEPLRAPHQATRRASARTQRGAR